MRQNNASNALKMLQATMFTSFEMKGSR